jgi:hypothetical protein
VAQEGTGATTVGSIPRLCDASLIKGRGDASGSLTENPQTCLVYDRPLPEEGLTWAALVDWWATETLHETNLHIAGHHL